MRDIIIDDLGLMKRSQTVFEYEVWDWVKFVRSVLRGQ